MRISAAEASLLVIPDILTRLTHSFDQVGPRPCVLLNYSVECMTNAIAGKRTRWHVRLKTTL